MVKLGSTVLDAVKPALATGMNAMADFVTGMTDKFLVLVNFFKTGDFSSAFREAFGVEEDSPIVGALLKIRETAIQVASAIPGILNGVGAAISSSLNAAIPVLEWFLTHGQATATAITIIGTAFLGLKAYAALASGLGNLAKTMDAVKTGAEGLSKAITIGAELNSVSGGLKAYVQNLTLRHQRRNRPCQAQAACSPHSKAPPPACSEYSKAAAPSGASSPSP